MIAGLLSKVVNSDPTPPLPLTRPHYTTMFLFCSTLESRGVSRPSRTLGWNAMDAAAGVTSEAAAPGRARYKP